MPTRKRNTLACGFVEDDLIAEALGENSGVVQQTVRSHLAACPECAQRLEQYKQVRFQLGSLPASEAGLAAARRALNTQLAQLTQDTRPRLVLSLWQSPLGPLRIGTTDKGVALVEFVSPDDPDSGAKRLGEKFAQFSFAQAEGNEGHTALTRKLEAYLNGSRHALDWALDDGLMRSDFQRQVLQAARAIPYGSLTTYLGLAERIGQPKAVRAVAQSLRYNPVPIRIPCHRIIGSNGSLTGYAGNKIALKRDILAVEGIPTVPSRSGFAIAQDRLYIGRQAERIFCRPGCKAAQGIRAGNRLFIASRPRAEEMGYAPCGVCRPDLRPLHPEAEPGLF